MYEKDTILSEIDTMETPRRSKKLLSDAGRDAIWVNILEID